MRWISVVSVLVLAIPGESKGRVPFQRIASLTQPALDRNKCSKFYKRRLMSGSESSDDALPEGCPFDKTGFVFLDNRDAKTILRLVYEVDGKTEGERRLQEMSRRASELRALIPPKTIDTALLLANYIKMEPQIESKVICNFRPDLKSLVSPPGTTLHSKVPEASKNNFLLPFYRILTRLELCGQKGTKAEAIQPMSIEDYVRKNYVTVAGSAPLTGEEDDLPPPSSSESDDEASETQTSSSNDNPAPENVDPEPADSLQIARMIDPHELLSDLHRQIETILSIKNLWNRLTKVGADVTEVSIDIIHLSALLELQAEIADQEKLLKEQFADVEGKIESAVKTAQKAFIPPESSNA